MCCLFLHLIHFKVCFESMAAPSRTDVMPSAQHYFNGMKQFGDTGDLVDEMNVGTATNQEIGSHVCGGGRCPGDLWLSGHPFTPAVTSCGRN